MTEESSWVFGLSETIATGALLVSAFGWYITHIFNISAQHRNRRLARLDLAEDVGTDMATLHAEYLTLRGADIRSAELSQQITAKGRRLLMIISDVFPDIDRALDDCLWAFHDFVTAHDRNRDAADLGSRETKIAFDRLTRLIGEARARVS